MALTVLIKLAGEDDVALTLDAPRLVIGRSKGCEILLPDPSVSPRHASIRLQGGSNLIVDEGSTNGIVVDGVKLPKGTPRSVRSGAMVRVGRVWLQLEFGAGVASKPAEVRAAGMDILAAQLRAGGEALAPYVEVTSGPAEGQRLELSDGAREYLLGRGADVDMKLADERCSRRHVAIERAGDAWKVRDLGSKQGATLDGEPLGRQSVRWQDGTELCVGETTLVLRDPLREAWEECLAAEDVKMRPEEWREAPPGAPTATPPPVVEAPAEDVLEPVQDEPAPPPPPVAPAPVAAIEPRGLGYATVDLLVALVAVGLICVSIAGLMYVLG